MSASIGQSDQKTKSNQSQQPWAPTIPYLTDLLGTIGTASSEPSTPTAGETSAYNNLTNLYSGGSPYTGQIGDLASQTLEGLPSQSGIVNAAYDQTKNALNPYVSGQYLDVNSNPYLQKLVNQAGIDATQAINSQFAGAGRDMSGINQQAVGRGVTQAELPILFNQFNQQQQNQLAATGQLSNAANAAATTSQGLDQQALAARAAGVPLAQSALSSSEWGPQNQLNLEQLFQSIPFQNLASYESLLLPISQLGQQQKGTSSTSGTSLGFGAKLLSDERYKEDLQQIGTLADGTPIYKFRYKGEDATRIGVKAQDVEQNNPGAVSEMVPGGPGGPTGGQPVKYVDMDKATAPSAAMMGGPQNSPSPGGPAPANGMPMMGPGIPTQIPNAPANLNQAPDQAMSPILQYLMQQQAA